ncbi:MAG TPA: hypothetical protein VK815_09830 [Candidatus Acidoferrales bacterium]|nr:hypothetical protein [Candidatus Acidoferrales bacterium]
MILISVRTAIRLPMLLLCFIFAASPLLAAAPTGPTLQLDYGRGTAPASSISSFMYFVPLISPDAVSVFTNIGNTQGARIQSFSCRTNGVTFIAICDFEFAGEGSLQNVFDHAAKIEHCQKELAAGDTLAHQLDSINVEGSGSGSVEITGTLTNGQRTVTGVRLEFNRRGHASPVSIGLVDIRLRDGKVRLENATTARVNTLVFRHSSGTPKMEVTLASVKSKGAGDGLWQNFVGDLKGAAVNLFLPPLAIEAGGQQAMLDFGLALASEKPVFTFPLATRLKAVNADKP